MTARTLENTPSTLCEKCSVLSIDRYTIEAERSHSWISLDFDRTDTLPDLPLLKASAAAGCAFCAALRRATLNLHITFSKTIRYRMSYEFGAETVGASVRFRMRSLEVNIFKTDGIGFPSPCLYFRPDHNVNPLCDQNVTELKQFLYDCETNCDCRLLHSPGFVPSRLLDLGSDHLRWIRLLGVADTTKLQGVRYTALSYCWGTPEVALHQSRSTSENIHANYDRIEFTTLSPVIRDAVITTVSLGLRYLWVDAMCIEQGSHEDWARESGQMGLVYSNAYFTIAAAKSKSCQEGFLERFPPIVILSRTPRDNDPHTFSLHDMSHSPDAWGSSLGAVWQSRGWTQQEVLLSRRVLYFTDLNIILSCPERQWMESKGIKIKPPQPPGTLALDYRRIEPGLLLSLQRCSTHKDSLHALWNGLVEEYSTRTLSDPKDLFPAISGIAKHFAGILQDEFIAGIWKGDLINGLLWMSEHRFASFNELLRRLTSSPYVCPTWSWGQRGYVFQRTYQGLRLEHKRLSASAVPEDLELNPWGRIIKADLQIEARCVSYSSTVTDIMGAPLSYRCLNGDQDHHNDFMDISVDWAHSETESDGSLEQTTLILLASHPGFSELHGLLLYPLPDGSYIRVGRFRSDINGGYSFPVAGEAPTGAEHKHAPSQGKYLGIFRDAPFHKFNII